MSSLATADPSSPPRCPASTPTSIEGDDEAADALLLLVLRTDPPEDDAAARTTGPSGRARAKSDLGESATIPRLSDRGVPTAPPGVSGSRLEDPRDATAARAAAIKEAGAPAASNPPAHGEPLLPPTARGGRSALVGVATADAAAVGGGGGGGGGDGGALSGTIA